MCLCVGECIVDCKTFWAFKEGGKEVYKFAPFTINILLYQLENYQMLVKSGIILYHAHKSEHACKRGSLHTKVN